MTVIVGMVDEEAGNVVVAADSMSSSPESAQAYVTPKLYAGHDGQVIVGISGSWRFGNLIGVWLRGMNLPLPEGEDEHEWVVCNFIPEIRTLLDNNGALRRVEDGGVAATDHATALVAVRGRLFILQESLSVGESLAGWDTAGAAHQVAAGALHALAGTASAERCVRAAVEAAIDYSPWCGEPVSLMRTRASS